MLADPEQVRAWLRGEAGPIRRTLSKSASPVALDSVAELFDQQGRPDMAAEVRRMAALLTVPAAESHDDHGT